MDSYERERTSVEDIERELGEASTQALRPDREEIVRMGCDPSRLEKIGNETKEELLKWKAQYKPGSPQHIAATVELGRRNDRMNLVKFCALIVAVLLLLLAAVSLIRHW